MAKLGLTQTKGRFTARGIVTGTSKENFCKAITTKTGKEMYMVNFGLEINNGKTIFMSMNGMVKDEVYYSKKDGGTYETKKVEWKKRYTFNEDGYRLNGITLGIEKAEDGTNIKSTLAEFDACEKIGKTLTDGMSVFVSGNIEYSTYNDRTSIKYVPTQIYLTRDDIDFDKEDFEQTANFEQTIVFNEIEKSEDGFTVGGTIVGYSEICQTEFMLDKSKAAFAKTLKSLKPYTALKVHGIIDVISDTEDVEVDIAADDGWGDPNPMTRVSSPTRRVMIITGADRDSVDTETYSEEDIDNAISNMNASKSAEKSFDTSSADWGTDGNDEDEDW